MKKLFVVILSLFVSMSAFAQHWDNRDHYNHGYDRGYNSHGEWHHEMHNGNLGWWFLVGGVAYLSEEAYLNSIRTEPVYQTYQPYVQPPYIYTNPPVTYIQQEPMVVPMPALPTVTQQAIPMNGYKPSTGWYCPTTGMFSVSSSDRCSVPWISKAY